MHARSDRVRLGVTLEGVAHYSIIGYGISRLLTELILLRQGLLRKSQKVGARWIGILTGPFFAPRVHGESHDMPLDTVQYRVGASLTGSLVSRCHGLLDLRTRLILTLDCGSSQR